MKMTIVLVFGMLLMLSLNLETKTCCVNNGYGHRRAGWVEGRPQPIQLRKLLNFSSKTFMIRVTGLTWEKNVGA